MRFSATCSSYCSNCHTQFLKMRLPTPSEILCSCILTCCAWWLSARALTGRRWTASNSYLALSNATSFSLKLRSLWASGLLTVLKVKLFGLDTTQDSARSTSFTNSATKSRCINAAIARNWTRSSKCAPGVEALITATPRAKRHTTRSTSRIVWRLDLN